MNQVVSLKMTDAELDLLAWLEYKLGCESRSQVLRKCAAIVAEQSCPTDNLLDQVRDWRRVHPPRRSAINARKIGPRRKFEIDSGELV